MQSACHFLILLSALEVRLEKRFYQVNESAGAVVEVCAVVSSLLECPITFPFQVTLKSSDDTAGNLC